MTAGGASFPSVSDIIVYHHALGLTTGVQEFANMLREDGHGVATPDLYHGTIFDSLEDGVGYAEAVGMDKLIDSGVAAATQHPADAVYAGFSLGALVAHRLAQTRPGARGALLYHYGDVPMDAFADEWPAGVPVQFHIAADDPWREPGTVEDFVGRVRPRAEPSSWSSGGRRARRSRASRSKGSTGPTAP